MNSKDVIDELGQSAVAGMNLFQWGVIQMMRNPLFFVGLIGLLVVQNNNIKLKVGKLLDIQL